MRVELFRTWDELQKLAPCWNALLQNSAADTIFLTWEWCEAWWKNYGAGRELCTLAVWDGDQLVAVAPLYRDTTRIYGVNRVTLRFIGDGSHDSDYLDCFAIRGREAEAVTAFLEFLQSGECGHWDELDLHGPVEGSPFLTAFGELAKARSWKSSLQPIACATLRFPATWQEYLQSLKPRFRSKVRSAISFFEKDIQEVPQGLSDVTYLEEWLEPLFRLHTRRWQSVGQSGVFQNKAKRAFYNDISRSSSQKGWLAFHRLDWGERPMALQYGFIYNQHFHLLQEGYDPDFETLRPGTALRGFLMKSWLEAGLKEYDFLAGTASYKFDWGGQPKNSYRLQLISPGASRAAIAVPALVSGGKDAVRRLVPGPVLAARKRLLTTRTQRPQNSAPTSAKQLLYSAAAHTYSLAPLQRLGRAVISRYSWGSPGKRFALESRTAPICQIFIFHRVNDDADPFLPAYSAAKFREQMTHIAKNFTVVSLDDVGKGNLPRNRHNYYAAITFDDGYRDNLLYAFPVLKELKIPATIFLATGYIESGRLPWYDQVCLAFKLTMTDGISLAAIGGPEATLKTRVQRLHALGLTLQWLRSIDEAARAKALPALFQELRVPAQLTLPNGMLSWEEVRRMSKEGVTFGAHTITHPVLASISSAQLEREIMGSKKKIEEKLQLPVRHFAYPFGRKFDVSQEARQTVQKAGFETAVTTEWGFNFPGDDPYELKRFGPWECDLATFALKLDWFRFRGFPRNPVQFVAARPITRAAVSGTASSEAIR